MNLDQQNHHVHRRTRSFDSYDNLDRLEELRQRRNILFANRALFERRPLLPPTPVTLAVPPTTEQSNRPVSPTSRLIQGFTDKLKEISTSTDAVDSKQSSPIPPKRNFSKIQVISLESPRKMTYKTTCHIFPTFKAPKSDDLEESKTAKENDTVGNVYATPFESISIKSSPQGSFSYLNDQIISRESSFTRNTEESYSGSYSLKQTNILPLVAQPFQRPIYEYDDVDNGSPVREPLAMKQTIQHDGVGRMQRNYQQIPVREPTFVKRQASLDSFENYTTPYQDVRITSKAIPVRKEIEKLNLGDSSKCPTPTPRVRTPSTSSVPQSFPTFLRQHSFKEWKPVDAPFNRTSSKYSSLPHRKNPMDRYGQLGSAVDDEPDSMVQIRDATFDTKEEQSFVGSRRISTGSVPEMKLRSRTSAVPVKDLVQIFSQK